MDAIANLKQNVITRFQKFLTRLGKGYTDDYSVILDEISLIQTSTNYADKELYPLCEHLINYVKK